MFIKLSLINLNERGVIIHEQPVLVNLANVQMIRRSADHGQIFFGEDDYIRTKETIEEIEILIAVWERQHASHIPS